jgi:hypothetical protein
MFIQIHRWQQTKMATDMMMIAGIEKLPVFHLLLILVIGEKYQTGLYWYAMHGYS